MGNFRKEVRDELNITWKNHLSNWKESGLPGTVWCHQNNLVYDRFLYWKRKFYTDLDLNLEKESFREILSVEKPSAIEILCKGFKVSVNSGFDPETLKQCLNVLGDL
jgi:hypothetical protein